MTVHESILSRNVWLQVAPRADAPISPYESNLIRRALGWDMGSRGEFDPLPPIPRLEANREYSAAGGAPGAEVLHGWSNPEAWGAWSDGTQAKLVFLADRAQPAALVMRGRLFAPVPDQPPRIYARVDGAPEETLLEARNEGEDIELHILLPANGKTDLVHVSLRFDTPRSPADYGVNSDRRLLALGLSWLTYKAAESISDHPRQELPSRTLESELAAYSMDKTQPGSERREQTRTSEDFAALD